MPLKIPPHSGQIVMCDYAGFVVPEMVKRRPVIVVSPKPRRHQGLCVVIPLSTTEPTSIEKHHIKIDMPDEIVKTGKFERICWAKCDIINTVSMSRLDLIRAGRDHFGMRKYSYSKIPHETLDSIRNAAFACLGGKI